MKDLEIRGAGNLLGGEQSGHIADVGFDLYVRLVGEAVHEFRGDAEPELNEVRIELPVDAHLPHDYIPSERLRLEMYKRLAEVRSDDDVDLLLEELKDRYGEPPRRGHLAAAGRAVPGPGPAGRHRRGHDRGQERPVRPGHAARVARRTPPAALPQVDRQGPGLRRSWCPRPHIGGVMGKPLDGDRPAPVGARCHRRGRRPGGGHGGQLMEWAGTHRPDRVAAIQKFGPVRVSAEPGGALEGQSS